MGVFFLASVPVVLLPWPRHRPPKQQRYRHRPRNQNRLKHQHQLRYRHQNRLKHQHQLRYRHQMRLHLRDQLQLLLQLQLGHQLHLQLQLRLKLLLQLRYQLGHQPHERRKRRGEGNRRIDDRILEEMAQRRMAARNRNGALGYYVTAELDSRDEEGAKRQRCALFQPLQE